jgi:hypothetical protein
MFSNLGPQILLQGRHLSRSLIHQQLAQLASAKCTPASANKVWSAHYKFNELNLNSKTSCGLGPKTLFQTLE